MMKAWRRGEAAMRKSTEHHSEPPPKEIKTLNSWRKDGKSCCPRVQVKIHGKLKKEREKSCYAWGRGKKLTLDQDH